MPYKIRSAKGQFVHSGDPKAHILFPTEAVARQWMKPGDELVPAEKDDGLPAIIE